ncbi:MAG: 50S ribosomal protein L24 [Spirochaetaceae bacterium]|nr:50S ribosomal protein L24 [Spirochaetaceae bacterium]
MNTFKIKKGDLVTIIAGKDKKRTGKILRVDRVKNRVIVEGCNIIKKTQKPRQQGEKGAILELEGSLHISNVMLNCSKCGPVRTAFNFKDDKKVRVCKKCGGVV